jgi:lipoprotein-anchoring transpeptidase ErfK/SrfK
MHFSSAQAVQRKGMQMKSQVFKSLVVAVIAGTVAGMATRVAAQNAPVRRIVVSLEDRKLALVEDGQVKKIYTVAVGKPTTPSPQGSFTIISGYGIHGTNEPKSIGKAASHGCIRMAKADLEEFYEMVGVGDQVEIVGQRNEETARLFEPAAPMQNKPAEQVAKAGSQMTRPAMAEPAPTFAAVALQAVMAVVNAAGSR